MKVEKPTPSSLTYSLFEWCRGAIAHHYSGSSFLYRNLCRAGIFKSFTYRIEGTPFCVPVSNPDNAWRASDIDTYETETLDALQAVVRSFAAPVFIDCGADIGTFSALLLARVPGIREIVAIEPRTEVLPWLRQNLAALPRPTTIVDAAVSDFQGKGKMCHPDYDDSGHACYLERDPAGEVNVVSIDSLGIATEETAVKIDVEGAELQVLKGAANLLSRSKRFVVVFEAHQLVAKRSKIDPIECLRFLNGIRPCEFRVAESDVSLDLSRPFFDQVALPVVNVVAWTK